MKLPRIRFSGQAFLRVGCTLIPTETICWNPGLKKKTFNLKVLTRTRQPRNLAFNLLSYFQVGIQRTYQKRATSYLKYDFGPHPLKAARELPSMNKVNRTRLVLTGPERKENIGLRHMAAALEQRQTEKGGVIKTLFLKGCRAERRWKWYWR